MMSRTLCRYMTYDMILTKLRYKDVSNHRQMRFLANAIVMRRMFSSSLCETTSNYVPLFACSRRTLRLSLHPALGTPRCSRYITTCIRNDMSAWQIHQYAEDSDLTYGTARVPTIRQPKDVLVEVHAASINPMDLRMAEGYGQTVINTMRMQSGLVGSEFPLTLGRDFSGVIVDTGKNVKKFKTGDEVWGALNVHKQGSHAQYTIASVAEISHKPASLSHSDAASVPYVAVTAWTALCSMGGLTEKNTPGKRVLVCGGSGGIGSFAIQLLKCWGAHVTATCSADAVDLVSSLGADVVIDYKTLNVHTELDKMESFDIILDTVEEEPRSLMSHLKAWQNAKCITTVPPVMRNTDQLGLLGGAAMSLGTLGIHTATGFQAGQGFRWAFFQPNGQALSKVAALMDDEDIKPVVEDVFHFDRVADAFDKVAGKHARGKTVISMVD